ncbi:MAG: orotidine-5'-phosphate decarboxylase [Gammaproteobacteria bacterium]|nr:orotidine-5'-phosphate decarboxylase [Gammaproteobacteria bacterium]
MSETRIIVALDYDGLDEALGLVDRIDPARCRLKVGKQLFTRSGPAAVTTLLERGFEVFLDLKFHDIPNTVASACRAAMDLGVWMLNVHAQGGRRMMEAAREAVGDRGPTLVAVTVLTSLGTEDLVDLGMMDSPGDMVLRLAALAEAAGLDGVVCSPRELAELRRERGRDFQLVTPGIRPAATAHDDQHRVMTPSEAMAAGSSYLVIGRPITAARDPMAALAAIEGEMGGKESE